MYLTVPDPWHLYRLRRLARLCRSARAEDQAVLIRQARALANVRPAARLFEVMVSAGAFESAVQALIGEEAVWMLSKGAGGRCLASVLLPGMEAEVTCEAKSPALALLGAWAEAGITLSRAKEAPPHAILPRRPAGALLH